MAVIRPIQSQRTIDVGGVPNTRVDGSVGQGLQQLGSAIGQATNAQQDLELRRERMRMQTAEFRADQEFRRFGDHFALDYAKTQQDIDPSGEGFTEAVSKQFNAKADEFLRTVPESLRPKVSELVATQRESFINKAAAQEVDQRHSWFRQGITESQEKLQTQVFNDPSLFEAALEDGARAIELSGLPTTEKQALLEAWKSTLALTLGEREVRDAEQNPEAAVNAAARLGVRGAVDGDMGAYRDAIASIESKGSGDYAAIGPRHKKMGRALGRYQIMEANIGPWSREALGREVTPEEFMANPQIQDAIFDHKFGGYVKRFGPEGAAQAWFAGPGGVGKTSRKDVLGTDVGSYGRRFVKALGKVAEESEPDPRYSSLPLEKRLELFDRTQNAAERGKAAISATLKAQYDQHKGSLELGIETGDVASELTILQDEILSDAHKADLLKSYRSKNEERIATADALAKFEAGALRVDPYDSKGKNTVDNVFKEMAKTVPVEDLQSTAEEIVRQTGVVPQAALNAIRGGLESQNIAEVAAAAQSAQRLASVDPAALSRRDGGKAVQDAADDFSYFVNRLNLSPEQAAQRLLDQRDPQKQRDRKALEPLVKDFIKERQDDDLASIFDESFAGWRSNPEIGFTPAQEAGIKAEYIAIAEDEFYRSGGDAEVAQNRAVERMKRLYGTTEVTGRKVVMKHPPERYWPAMVKSNINRSKSLHWTKQQLKRDLSEFAPDIDMDKVQLVTTPQTDAMVKRGEMPAYGVLYQDADGVWQTIPGKLWRPDPSAEKERAQIEQSAEERESQRRMDRAIFSQGQQRINAQDREAGRNRETTLDSYLGGPVEPPKPSRVTPPTQQEQLQEQRQDLMNGKTDRFPAPNPARFGG
ncbi:hypothetical protein [Nitratireductor basaltis]|uniref:Uncharacterized protein n=1 Tax=Nitratireductor basaltis TaxID=472175 RepID=A0A084UDJ1_9HYPH|nr:hypothetical protein [Nitratireductor basaltis]KFB11027.1 hypothetical protein EL18_02069 [Nitratireductor basaltis]